MLGGLAMLAGLLGCAPSPRAGSPVEPEFLGAEVRELSVGAAVADALGARPEPIEWQGRPGAYTPLAGDLVMVSVQVREPRVADPVELYTHCVAAGYAQGKGYRFVRHIRTNLVEESGLWRADAVYTISRAQPRGALTMEARTALARCADEGIPTV